MKRSIGAVIRERRRELGLSQAQLCAFLTNYDAGNLSRFELGGQRIDEARLDEIAAALKTTAWELFRARDAAAHGISPELEQNTAVQLARAAFDAAPAAHWPFFVAVERLQQLPKIDKVRVDAYLQATVDAWESRMRKRST